MEIVPATQLDLSSIPPEVDITFDLRWNCARRVGLGDKIVALMAAKQYAQALNRPIGIEVNDEDAPIATLCGLRLLEHINEEERVPRGIASKQSVIIPLRDHPMAHPLGANPYDVEGAEITAHSPLARVLYGWGLFSISQGGSSPLRAFKPPSRANRKNTLDNIGWSPLEVSRKGWGIEPADWWRVLDEAIDGGAVTITATCRTSDEAELRELVDSAPRHIRERITCKPTATLGEWYALMLTADRWITSNSGGLWVALQSPSLPITVVQRVPETAHQALWTARPSWSDGLSIVSLPSLPAQQEQRPTFPPVSHEQEGTARLCAS